MNQQRTVFLHVIPQKTGASSVAWEEFHGPTFPSFAIALDGFVGGPPAQDLSKPCVNFNHHEGVVRFATRATCEQVKVALDMGFLEDVFTRDGKPYAHVFVNDGDEDVCTSWAQLSRYPHFRGPLLTRLINVQGLLDMSAGAYPIDPKAKILREFAWIYEPYVEARMSHRLQLMSSGEMRGMIERVCNRIDQYMAGKGQDISLDTSFDIVRVGTGWTMVHVRGYYARIVMRAQGIKAFVNFRGEHSGNFVYSVGCEPFSGFPLLSVCAKLSEAEVDGRMWGGGDTIIGSPRGIGSTLDPDQVFEIIENIVKKKKQ